MAKSQVTETTKDTKFREVWQTTKEFFYGRQHVMTMFRHVVNQVGGCGKGMMPIGERNIAMVKKNQTSFNNVTMLEFKETIMLRRMVGW